MAAHKVAEIPTSQGVVSLWVSGQKAPKHAWQVAGILPKMTWKLDGKSIMRNRAAHILYAKAMKG